jgi:hypothetical protein
MITLDFTNPALALRLGAGQWDTTAAIKTGCFIPSTKTVRTNFDVPAMMETGYSTLVVVANGIPSEPVDVYVH